MSFSACQFETYSQWFTKDILQFFRDSNSVETCNNMFRTCVLYRVTIVSRNCVSNSNMQTTDK